MSRKSMDRYRVSTDKPPVATPAAAPSTSATPAVTPANTDNTVTTDKPTVSRSATAKKFAKSYAKTWIGMSPIFLMAEALTPGAKVGTQFRSGSKDLLAAATELRDVLATSASDVLVIVDKQFATAGLSTSELSKKASGAVASAGDTARVQALIREAGDHAIVAVTTALSGAQAQLQGNKPELKAAIAKNGKDVLVLVDKALKSPIVVTGVTKFAKSKGIPYSVALIELASLGIDKLLKEVEKIEREVGETAAAALAAEQREKIHEMTAEELEGEASDESKKRAKEAGEAPIEESEQKDEKKAGGSCVIV